MHQKIRAITHFFFGRMKNVEKSRLCMTENVNVSETPALSMEQKLSYILICYNEGITQKYSVRKLKLCKTKVGKL